MAKKKVTIPYLKKKKEEGKKITMLTAYDYPISQMVNEAEIDIILVGDSLAMVFQGLTSTVPVTVDETIYHCKAVMRGNTTSHVVGDMPFLSYQTSVRDAVYNAGRIMKEGGVDSVKLEGGERMAEMVYGITRAGIPVMGHIGLTPQSASQLGGFRVQGKDIESARQLIKDAIALEEAGAFALILEAVPSKLAKIVTEKVKIPTIGIGAGPYCDGQVLVTHDMLGVFDKFRPKFVKVYADIRKQIIDALIKYREEVEKVSFPTEEYSYEVSEETEKMFEEIAKEF